MKKLYFVILTIVMSIAAIASTPSTEGTEFWLTFMNNLDESNSLELKIAASSRYDAVITVQNPQTNWSQTFNVQANQIAELTLPKAQAYTESSEMVEKHGLRITSTADISLYAQNYSPHTYDATLVMSVDGLGTQYIIQTYENELFAKECAIVATENNTTVTITPHARTTGNKPKNVPFQVTLNRGETYQVMSLDGNADFSGTRIESDKKIAVFSGHRCINTPTGNRWCDHIVEQQMPTEMWGRQFVVTKTKGQYGDMVMVTASQDNTVVKINNTQVTTLQALESYEFRLTDNSSYIETSQPSAVFLYLEGAERNNMIGDPSSVHISPIEQMIPELTFGTFQTNESRTHYVNIVTTIAGAAAMMLDNTSIASEFQPVQGNNALRFAQVHLQHGTHTLNTTKDGFIGHVYGVGWCESYAYTFGSATLALDGQILVNGEPRINIDYNDSRCYKQDITFSVNANTPYNSVDWDLGDGTKSSQSTIKHTYTSAGDYQITMIITNDDGRDTARTSLHLVEILHDTVYATICDNEKYVLNGTEYSTDGTFNQTLTSADGCDSIVTLILSVKPTQSSTETASIPLGSSYRWHWKWFNTAGEYRDTLSTVNGCDSVCLLNLETVDQTETIYDTICYQSTYSFGGQTFNIPSITGMKDNYVDFIIELRDLDNCSANQLVLSVSTLAGGDYEIFDTIQQGMTYEFYGQHLTTPGTYTATASSGRGCEQNYTLHLAVLSFPIMEDKMSFCHEDQITWRNKTYNKTGVYNDTVFIPAGIKEIHRLTLTDNRSRTELSVQATGSYTLNGQTYTESGTYTQTMTNAAGCDSLIILHLGIGEPCTIETEENIQLCAGSSITWNGKTYNTETTDTYKTTSKDGCDSIVTLNLTVIQPKTTLIEQEICSGDFFRYNGDRLSEAKEYTYTFTSADGCDSIVTIRITYKGSYNEIETREIEEGQTTTWEGQTYSKSGTYYKGFIAKNECDSIRTLVLKVSPQKVKPSRDEIFEETICYGAVYDFYGTPLTVPGTYIYTEETNDEFVNYILTLNVNPVFVLDEYATISEGQTYEWNGNIYDQPGDYTFNGKNELGCDSIVTLHLIVSDKPMREEQIEEAICEGSSYEFDGKIITTAGTYSYIEETDDEFITHILILNVNPVEYSEETITIEEGQSIEWNGTTYSAAGTYTANLTNRFNCDSIATLHLIVEYSKDIINTIEESICEGDYYNFFGENLTQAGTYTHTEEYEDYNEITELILTVNQKEYREEYVTIKQGESYTWLGEEYTEAGDYEITADSENECGLVAILHLKVESEDVRIILTDERTATICNGDTYNFYGEQLTVANIYTHKIEYADYDSIITLTLKVNPSYHKDEYATIEEGESYTWNNRYYTTAGEYTFNGKTRLGCDSIVTLHLTVNRREIIDNCTMQIGNSCADERAIELHITYDNEPDYVRISFTGRDNAAGLPDTTIYNVSEYITIHHNARAGQYKANAQLYINNKVVGMVTSEFTLLYPSSVLEQAWNDAVIVLAHNYNGGYDFKAFQWYKNGNLLLGETGSYIYQPLEFGAAYSAMLTETNGIQIMTCPLIAEPHEDISLYPTRIRRGDRINCKVSDKAVMYVYNATGKIMLTKALDEGESTFSLPLQQGLYIVNIVLETTQTAQQFKIVVND